MQLSRSLVIHQPSCQIILTRINVDIAASKSSPACPSVLPMFTGANPWGEAKASRKQPPSLERKAKQPRLCAWKSTTETHVTAAHNYRLAHKSPFPLYPSLPI
jgi:hypothetical protein